MVGGNKPLAELLISHGADVKFTASNGTTVIHMATRQRHAEMIPWLAKQGADVNSVSSRFGSPLDLAVAQADPKSPVTLEVVDILKSLGAKHRRDLPSATQSVHAAHDR